METASRRPPGPKWRKNSVRALQSTIGVAVLLATLFTALPSRGLASGDFYNRLSVILTLVPWMALRSSRSH